MCVGIELGWELGWEAGRQIIDLLGNKLLT